MVTTTPMSPKLPMNDSPEGAASWCSLNLPNSTPEIIQGAADEGRLALALQMLGDDQTTQAMIQRFTNLFPFVKVSWTSAYAIELNPMLLNDFDSGHGIHDHFQISSDLDVARQLRNMGALQRFVVSQDEAYPDSAKSSGYWYARTRTPVVTVYRKDALSTRERALLRSYRGIGDPCFRNRLGILDVSAAMAAITTDLIMHESEPETWDCIAANRPMVRSAGGPLLAGLIAGEYDVAVFGPLGTALQAVRTGAPVEFVCTSPSPRLYGALGVISSVAPNPNAARLWADWSTSRDAADLFASLTGHQSPRYDAPLSWFEQQPWYFEDPARTVTLDWSAFALRKPDVLKHFRRGICGD